MVRHALPVALLALLGCGSTASKKTAPPHTTEDLAALSARLTLPTSASATSALAQLDRRADDDPAAAWHRTHYLLDLFDDARFRGDEDSLGTLAGALGVSAVRGSASTDRVVDRLLIEVDRVLSNERLHDGANAARTLLELDRQPPTAGAFADYARTVRRIASSDGPLAANAIMRLAGRCERALRDAAGASPRHRWARTSFCLWTLHGEDPAPYAEHASMVDSRWLAADLIGSYQRIAKGRSRLTEAARSKLAILPTWFERNGPRLPTPPPTQAAPQVAHAHVYGHYPTFSSAADARTNRLDLAISGDGRATATWLGGQQSTSADLRAAAGVATSAGAVRMTVLVKSAVDRKTLPTLIRDRTGDKPFRPGTLPLYLQSARSTGPAAGVPRGQRWNPDAWQAGLTIEVGPKRWSVAVTGGVLAEIPAGDASALGAAVDRVLDAYPDSRTAVLAPLPGTSLGVITKALAAALFRKDGTVRLSQVALGDEMTVRRPDLRSIIARRAAAWVTIDPETLADRLPIIRRCYQDLIQRNQRLRVRFELELRGEAVYVSRGPKRGPVWSCVVPAVTDAMSRKRIRRATIQLAPKARAGSR